MKQLTEEELGRKINELMTNGDMNEGKLKIKCKYVTIKYSGDDVEYSCKDFLSRCDVCKNNTYSPMKSYFECKNEVI